MTIRHMRILLAVMEEGGMGRAAEKLRLTQPAISLAVKELEKYYGVSLFDRIGRRLRPTEEGRRMADYAARIVALFDGMETSMRDGEAAGSLRVGASITVGNCLMPDWAAQFEARYPHVRLQVVVDDTDALIAGVLGGALDMAVIEGQADDPALTARFISADEMCVVCAPDHPFARERACDLKQFARADILTREPGSAARALLEGALLAVGIEAKPKWQSVSTQALFQAAGRGLGVAMLPRLLAQPHLDSGDLVAVNVRGLAVERAFWLIHHKNKYLGPAAGAFVALTGAKSRDTACKTTDAG